MTCPAAEFNRKSRALLNDLRSKSIHAYTGGKGQNRRAPDSAAPKRGFAQTPRWHALTLPADFREFLRLLN